MAWWKRTEPEPFDPYALGARRSDPELAALEPLPAAPRRLPTKTLLVYFVLGVAVIAFIREGTGRPLKVDGSCTKPAFALNRTEVKSGGVLKFGATGPATDSVVFGLDTDAVPTSTSPALLYGPALLTGCKAGGRFGVQTPEGNHVLTVFLVHPDGSFTVLGTQKLVIDDPRGP